MEILNIGTKNYSSLEGMSEKEVLEILEKGPNRISEIPVSKRTFDVCEVVAKNTGEAKILKYIPKKMWNDNLYFSLAVYNPFYITSHIPNSIKTKDWFKKVLEYKIDNNIFNIFDNGRDIYFADSTLYEEMPKTLLTKKLCLRTVKCEGILLGMLPIRFKTPEICEAALNNNPEAVRFLPENLLSSEVINQIMTQDGLLLKYIPEDKITLKICCTAIENNIEAKKYIPGKFKNRKTILKKLRELETINNESFYERNIACYKKILENLLVEEREISGDIIAQNKRKSIIGKIRDDKFKVYYITDIHLNHKLLKQFPSAVSKIDIVKYVKNCINQMLSTMNIGIDDYLLIGGDVSFCFEISEIFYYELIRAGINPRHIIAVLGNHELWNFNRFAQSGEDSYTIEKIVELYRNMFKRLRINFLHNDLLVVNNSRYEYEKLGIKRETLLSESQLLSLEEGVIFDICQGNKFIVFGGLGFTGYNDKYNDSAGLYRKAIMTKEEDLQYTTVFEKIYLKLSRVLSENNITVLTHTPKRDWTTSPYINNWVFVSGHTHHNRFFCDNNQRIYEDNQMGYDWAKLRLKYFIMSKKDNIFEDLTNGIYKISKQQYIDFNYSIGNNCEFNDKQCEILMCKNNVYYMFFVKKYAMEKLYLLNGGVLNCLQNNNIKYYYEHMLKFCKVVNSSVVDYFDILKRLAKDIQKIGGIGNIHGSIIDIDYFNHIYFNPNDGTVHPYYSPQLGVQIKYNKIIDLIQIQCPKLYENYLKLLKEKNETNSYQKELTMGQGILSFETEQYKQSLLIKKIQYITDKKVIRIWNDDLLQKCVKKQKRTDDTLLLN